MPGKAMNIDVGVKAVSLRLRGDYLGREVDAGW
jgi:hypothetical protein